MGSHQRRARRALPTAGLPPGTLKVDPASRQTSLRAFGYTASDFEERAVTHVAELKALGEKWPMLWVDAEGLGDEALLRELAALFSLHPLAMEDVIDTTQRAKVEPYGDVTFMVVPMPHAERGFSTEQLSIFLGPRWVITFQEAAPGDCLNAIRDRIRSGKGRVRTSGPAYLAYALMDAVVDGYFPILERVGERLECLEESVLHDPAPAQIHEIRNIKHELMRIRRAVWPMRDATTAMNSLESVFSPEIRLYIRDAHDHVVRLMDMIETDRYMASDLLEIHMTATSNRLGEVNKFLTVIATIFLPLSWIAGVYGMNFTNIPEISWRYGYPFALLLMAACAAVLLYYFKRRGWLAPSVFGPGSRDFGHDQGGAPKESASSRRH